MIVAGVPDGVLDQAERARVYVTVAQPGDAPLPPPPPGVPWVVVVSDAGGDHDSGPEAFSADLAIILKRAAGFGICFPHNAADAAAGVIKLAARRQCGVVLVETDQVRRFAWARFVRSIAPLVRSLDPASIVEPDPPDPGETPPNRHSRRVEARRQRQDRRRPAVP